MIFDNNWKVTAIQKKYHDPEEICPHVDARPQQYIEWTIECYDGNKDIQTFYL